MKHFRYLLGVAGFWIAAVALAGCSLLSPVPDKSRFFLLTAMPSSEAGSQAAAGGLTLGLGPIKFPPYLDRTEVVTRVEPNRLVVSENDHWGEPLKTNFTRVLSENLSTLLGTQQIVSFPWYSSTHLDYTIAIEVTRFEADAQGAAQLSARWSIEDPATKKVLDRGDSNLSAPGASGADGSAAALSQVLANFSRQLTTAIGQVSAQRRLR
jgi:uncharacterized lipoprotein YmbA